MSRYKVDQCIILILVEAYIVMGAHISKMATTQISFMSIVTCQAVDIFFLSYANQIIYLLITNTWESAFQNIETIAQYLVDEFINVANGSSNSYDWTFGAIFTIIDEAYKDLYKILNE